MDKIKSILIDTFNLNTDCATPEEISERIKSGGQLRGTNMCIMILAMFIASIGLNMNSPAVIIGAMLISPLMGGIMNIGYGIATYDMRYVRHAFMKLAFQVVFCVMVSTVYFMLSPITAPSGELSARTSPTIWDVLIAIFGGLAGIIGNTRKEKVSNVIPGVAIATALMPPLCTAGYGIARHSWKYFGGAMYLFFINCFFICLTTFIVLKIMHIPVREYVSPKTLTRQKIYVVIFGIVMVLPSIFLAYQMIQHNVVNSQFSSFVASQFDFEDTQVVSRSLDTQNGIIRIAVVGKRLDSDSRQSIEESLQDYSQLKGMRLVLTQTEFTGGISKEEVESLINSEMTAAEEVQTDLESQNKALQEKIDQYRPAYMQFTVNDSIQQQLMDELPLFFPQIQAVDCAAQGTLDEDKNLVMEHYLLILHVDSWLDMEAMDKLEEWAGKIIGGEVIASQKPVPGLELTWPDNQVRDEAEEPEGENGLEGLNGLEGTDGTVGGDSLDQAEGTEDNGRAQGGDTAGTGSGSTPGNGSGTGSGSTPGNGSGTGSETNR